MNNLNPLLLMEAHLQHKLRKQKALAKKRIVDKSLNERVEKAKREHNARLNSRILSNAGKGMFTNDFSKGGIIKNYLGNKVIHNGNEDSTISLIGDQEIQASGNKPLRRSLRNARRSMLANKENNSVKGKVKNTVNNVKGKVKNTVNGVKGFIAGLFGKK